MRRFLIIIALLLFTISSQAQDIFQAGNNLYSTEESLNTESCSEKSFIYISSAATLTGSIRISTSDEDSITISHFIKAKTSSKKKAIDYIDLISVNFSKSNKGYKIEMRSPNPKVWADNEAGIVEIELTLPKYCDIEIDAVYFDITADGPFRNFMVPTSLGRLTVDNVTGKLELATSNRRLKVSNVTGETYLSTSNSTLFATDIISPNKKITMYNEGGDINVDNITGEVNIKNKYGRIDINNYKPSGLLNKIRCDNGPIILEITEINATQILISNRFEDIELVVPRDISAELSLAVEEDGKIDVSNLPFKPDLVQPNRLNLITKDGASLITSSIRGKGNIYLRGRDDD